MVQRRIATLSIAVVCGLTAACGEPTDDTDADDRPPCQLQHSDDEGQPFDQLSDYCFFRGDPAAHQPSEGVFAYDISAPLYSDGSHKRRFIVLPDGESIGFDAQERWSWPEGTIIVKTFYFPIDEGDPDAGENILETRLLIKDNDSWDTQVYMWDEDQQDAQRNNVGRRVDVTYTDAAGDDITVDYRIPNANQCANCHGQDGDVVPIGPRTRQMTHAFQDADDAPAQLEVMASQDMFDQDLPALDDLPAIPDYRDDSLPIDDRARSYLDANCAHCHNDSGRASSSGLFLDIDITDEHELGVCKTPVAAGGGSGGRPYDIVPGAPDESIMIYRMDTTDSSVKMPELPLTTIDPLGVDLVSQWIADMEPTGCD